jgi:membrane protease YdiL (CAAX protease family)
MRVPSRRAAAYGACVAIGSLNDFAYIALSGSRAVLVVDYVCKASFIALSIALAREVPSLKLGGLGGAAGSLFYSLALAVLGIAVYSVLVRLWPSSVDFWPKDPGDLLLVLDLTFGLALTSFAEELAFRHLALATLGASPPALLLSSACFGLIHWGEGVGLALAATAVGGILVLAYRHTRSFPLICLSHYLMDLWFFARWLDIQSVR